jgi:hypothetical protein
MIQCEIKKPNHTKIYAQHLNRILKDVKNLKGRKEKKDKYK